MDFLRTVGGWLRTLLAAIGGLIVLSIVALIAFGLSNRGPKIADQSVLVMDLKGELPEYAATDFTTSLLGNPTLTFKDQLDNLKKAAKDNRIKGVLVKLDGLGAGWAQIQELRDAFTEFHKSGKFAIGYSEAINERGYFLALALDSYYMPPTGFFEMNGLTAEVTHWPGLLQKLGVGVQYFRYGKYKSQSGESLGRTALSEPVKEMINLNLDEEFGVFVKAVADGKKLSVEQVKQLIDTNLPNSEWALEHKLIDGIAYTDEVESMIKKRIGVDADKDLEKVKASDYGQIALEDLGLNKGPNKVGIVYSVGLIVAGEGGGASPLSSGPSQGAEPIIRALQAAGKRDDIKAVVFRVDSPGGAGLGCDLVRRAVEQLAKKKPVIVSMGNYAASGGYWVSMDATAIVADPLTLTGSIGIWSVLPNVEALNKNLALNVESFKRGNRADALSGNHPLNPENAKIFDQELLKDYQRFVQLAAQGRHKSLAAMQEVAQGRAWLGAHAQTLGLVDKLGGFDTAVALAAEKVKVAPTDLSLEVLQKQESSLGTLLGQNATGLILQALGIERTVQKFKTPLSLDLLLEHHTFPLMEPVKVD
jgi:protease IV